MTRTNWFQLLFCGLLLGTSAWLLYRHFRSNRPGEEQTFFYDLSERKLFAASRTGIPPIRGINDNQEDAFRAVVISTNGNPADKSAWKIAYLEKCSPELKQQFETARAQGTAAQMSRTSAQEHRFVRRLTDEQWYPMNTPEAQVIVSEWLTAGPGGGPAAVCTP